MITRLQQRAGAAALLLTGLDNMLVVTPEIASMVSAETVL
jgi:hypothetical protein